VPRVQVALGAVNPLTRHPAVLAMTGSSLDAMAPGRLVLTLGTGLPLRLAQMGIDYDPDAAIADVERAIASLRALWRGDRLPAPDGDVPDLAPMFPPTHRVPIYVAGYRKAFHELAGRVADGYLARPAESVAALRVGAERIAAAARASDRDPGDVAVAGYLLTLVGASRRAALNRAKREPFVIYMMSVQSDVALRRAGLDPQVRHQVAAAWRAEDYHRAAELIPDELLDAFVLCGTPEQIATRVEDYREAGMTRPLLQPVVQDDDQLTGILDAAAIYGFAAGPSPSLVEAGSFDARPDLRRTGTGPREPVTEARTRGLAARIGGRLGAVAEIARPFSLTASAVPVAAAGALAAVDGQMHWALFAVALVAGVLLQVGTNVVNEIFDVRQGVDAITSPRASHALLEGRLTERAAFGVAAGALAASAGIGIGLIAVRGWPVALLGLLGLAGGVGYTAPPLQYKYRAVGLPLVFVLMGPLMVLGGYYVVTGDWSLAAGVASIPIGLLVTAILHGNEWRDTAEDARAGIATLSIRLGRRTAHGLYLWLVVGAYVALALAVAAGALPPLALLAVVSLPLLVRAIRASELGASGQARAIALIDIQTAQLHASFGALLVAGLAIAAAV
jgi:1,4-dihydroxy-2-naphthoate octaprenyltransferase